MRRFVLLCLTATMSLTAPAMAAPESDEDGTPISHSQVDERGDAALLDQARRLLVEEKFEAAQSVLKQVQDQNSTALAYWGYTHRKLGDMTLGLSFYERALQANPNNIAARSYLGQALLELGDTQGAMAQLDEIDSRGGAGSEAARQLLAAINGTAAANKY